MKRQFLHEGADFSPCRTWRYRLWRVWDPSLPPMAAGMLNPSRADEHKSDNTVSNQINRATRMGLGSLVVFNAYAFVTTYPDELKSKLAQGFDIVGPDNDAHTRAVMLDVRDRGGLVTVGWGKDGGIGGRDIAVAALAVELGIELHSLGMTMRGQPRHPRGVPKEQAYVPWRLVATS